MRIPWHEIEFKFARSSGPGGQNVNKVSSKAILRWDVNKSETIPLAMKDRFIEKFANRINKDGIFVISSDHTRDQARNRQDCVDKFESMLRSVSRPPKKRRKTKPTRASKERRLSSKKKQGDKKRTRSTGKGSTGWD